MHCVAQAELHMICVEEMPHLPTTIDEVVEQEDEERRRFAPVIERARKLASLHGVNFIVQETPIRSTLSCQCWTP